MRWGGGSSESFAVSLRATSVLVGPGFQGEIGSQQRVVQTNSVIIGDRDVGGVAVFERKDDAELVVHADGVLPLELSFESFEVIAWRGAEVEQRGRGVEGVELAKHDRPDRFGDRSSGPRVHAIEDVFGGLVGEVRDHEM